MKDRRLSVLAFFALSVLLVSCAKKDVSISQNEVQGKKILLMVRGEPDAYVWTEAGMSGASAAFGLVGATAALVTAKAKGSKLEKEVGGYPLKERLLKYFYSEFEQKLDLEVVRVCRVDEAYSSDCVEVNDVHTLKSQYGDDLLLAVKPVEWGLRNKKPYISLKLALFDISTGESLWNGAYSPKEEDVRVTPRKMDRWLEDTEELTSCLDTQVEKAAKTFCTALRHGTWPTSYGSSEIEDFME